MSKLDGSYNRNFNVENLTTEQLEILLSTLSEDKDMPLIIHIMEVIAERESIAPTGRIRNVDDAWAEFQTNYMNSDSEVAAELSIPSTNISDLEPKSVAQNRRRFPLSARIASAVATIFLAANIFSLSAFGANIFKVIASWNGDGFIFGEALPPSYDHLGISREADVNIRAFDSPHLFIPNYIPEEFYYFDCNLTETPFQSRLTLDFVRDDQKVFSIIAVEHFDMTPSELINEKDDFPITQLLENDIYHFIFNNIDTTSATWTIENYEFFLQGSVTKEEMQEIIASIYNYNGG